jgi:hypothetical protein
VPDRKPPKLVAGERETLLALLQYQRDSFVRKLDGLDDAAARKELVPSGTSLLWLTKHVTFAEQTWFVWRFAGRHDRRPDNSVQADDTLERATPGTPTSCGSCSTGLPVASRPRCATAARA